MTSPDEIHKLFILKRTQVEMIVDRGFPIPEDEISLFIENPDAERPTDRTYRDFVKRYTVNGRFSREALSNDYTDENGHITSVYFVPSIIKDKQGISVINGFVTSMTDIGANSGIIISQEDFTSEAKRHLDLLTSPAIQVFFDNQLYVNPTRHEYVPKHTKLSEEERRVFFEQSRLKPGQLVSASIDDPIIRYYGWSIGDVIKIERTNLATNKTMVKSSLAYRIVTRTRFDQPKSRTSVKVVSGQKED